jgi:Holliday junction resolvase-like predicted endonuclease
MDAPFKLPTVKKSLESWEAFEQKITNIFKYGALCEDAQKIKVGGFEIDCLARNENVIYVIECKSRAELSKTNQKIKDYIVTFAGKKRSISNHLRQEDKQRDWRLSLYSK